MKMNMFLLDWVVFVVWVSLFGLGIATGTVIMLPVTLIFGILNYSYSKKMLRLFLLDMNLMMASTAGIMLHTFLFIRFVYADRETVSMMVAVVFFNLFFITMIMIVSMIARDSGRKKRNRIINSLASGNERDSYRRGRTQEEEEEEEEESGEAYHYANRDSFLHPLGSTDPGQEDEEEAAEEEEPDRDDDEDDDEDGKKGPKFRVIVKDKK